MYYDRGDEANCKTHYNFSVNLYTKGGQVASKEAPAQVQREIVKEKAKNKIDWKAEPAAVLAAVDRLVTEPLVRLRELRVPVIAAVHGKVIGGAMAFFLNTDHAVADADARFQHGNAAALLETERSW